MNFGSEISEAFIVCIAAIFTQNIPRSDWDWR
ncbi:MAG: hypothetical protein BWY71_01264 [Planctomycetes bacterium ADurb.Bin412]|nr:MAG: hypothetical protein BWY71_01264 [Planctomycetes bacterium ADurb.Bin412]